MLRRLKSWLREKFQSRAQRDRESGYYHELPRVGSAQKTIAEQLDELFAETHRTDRRRLQVVRKERKTTVWERFTQFWRTFGCPNPKEVLGILFQSEWLYEKLWPKWDPTAANKRVAPPAGYYDADTGKTYARPFVRCTRFFRR